MDEPRSREFVGCLVVYEVDPSTTRELLREEFQKFGRVRSTNVVTNKTQQLMGFVNMASMEDAAAAVANLHQRQPYNWTIRLNEPLDIRKHRGQLRSEPDRAAAELTPELKARVEDYTTYETEIKGLVQEFASKLNVQEFQGPRSHSRNAYPTHTNDAAAVQVIYEPRLQSVQPLPCSVCGTPTSGHCHRCKTRYCSRPCQVADWEVHAVVCREPELPSLVVTGSDAGGGDSGGRLPGRGAWRGGRPLRTAAGDSRSEYGDRAGRWTDGYQSEVEAWPGGGRGRDRGRGRVRGSRGGRGGGPGGDGHAPALHWSPPPSVSSREPEAASSAHRAHGADSISSPPRGTKPDHLSP